MCDKFASVIIFYLQILWNSWPARRKWSVI